MQKHNLHSDRCPETHTNPDSLPEGHGNAPAHVETHTFTLTPHLPTCACRLPPPPAQADGCTRTQTLPHSHPVQAWEPMGYGLSQPRGSASILAHLASLEFPEELYPALPPAHLLGQQRKYQRYHRGATPLTLSKSFHQADNSGTGV